MKKLMILVTIIAEIEIFVMNVAMAEAWMTTKDTFYYVMGNIMWILSFGLVGSWWLIIKHDHKNRKARE